MNQFKQFLIFKDRIMGVGTYSAWEAECRGVALNDAPLDLSQLVGIEGGRGGFKRNVIPHARNFNKKSPDRGENSSQSNFMECAFWTLVFIFVAAAITAFCEVERF